MKPERQQEIRDLLAKWRGLVDAGQAQKPLFLAEAEELLADVDRLREVLTGIRGGGCDCWREIPRRPGEHTAYCHVRLAAEVLGSDKDAAVV